MQVDQIHGIDMRRISPVKPTGAKTQEQVTLADDSETSEKLPYYKLDGNDINPSPSPRSSPRSSP